MIDHLLSIIFTATYNLLNLLQFALFITIILSWFPQASRNRFAQFVNSVTMPMLGIAYRIMPIRIGVLDLTPILVFLILGMLQGVVLTIAQYFEIIVRLSFF